MRGAREPCAGFTTMLHSLDLRAAARGRGRGVGTELREAGRRDSPWSTRAFHAEWGRWKPAGPAHGRAGTRQGHPTAEGEGAGRLHRTHLFMAFY